jgi:lipopolysaccharide heptosyltransferase II
VLTLPALDALARHRPQAPITVATREPALDVYDGHPDVTARVRLPTRREGDRLAVRALGAGHYGAALVFSPSFRSALQLARARIPRRIGFSDDMRWPLLTHVVGRRRGLPAAHQVRDYLDIAAFVGAPVADPVPRIRPRAEHREHAQQLVEELNAVAEPLVAVAPFAGGGTTKRWPRRRFAELCVALARKGVRTAIIGGPADGPAAHRLRGSVARRGDADAVTPLVGPRTVAAVPLAALASMLPCLVTNDTGPMHVWAAGGGRVVAIFGSSLPAFHGPLGPGHRIVHRDALPCAGCYRRSCPHGLECLRSIPVGEVLEQVEELLDHRDS